MSHTVSINSAVGDVDHSLRQEELSVNEAEAGRRRRSSRSLMSVQRRLWRSRWCGRECDGTAHVIQELKVEGLRVLREWREGGG